MPAYTANGIPIVKGRICLPRTGAWHADLVLDTAEPVQGSIQLGLGAIGLMGTTRRSSVALDTCIAKVVGGAGGLPTKAPAKSYIGVPLSVVLADLAKVAGEKVSESSDPEVTGRHLPEWVTINTEAGFALTQLVEEVDEATWRVLPDG